MKRVLGLVALSLFAFTACTVEPGTEGENGAPDEDEVSDIDSDQAPGRSRQYPISIPGESEPSAAWRQSAGRPSRQAEHGSRPRT